MMFLLILVVLAFVLWFFGVFGNRRGSFSFLSAHTDALEILKQRYARGEIDKTEYESRRKDLTETNNL
jgi:putative membrane protein